MLRPARRLVLPRAVAMASGEGSLGLARKSVAKGGRHGVSVGLFGHIGIIREERLQKRS